MFPEMIGGFNVITNPLMLQLKDMMVWVPCGGGWKKHVMRTVAVPRRDVIMTGNTITVHPAMMPELRKIIADGQIR